MTDTDWQPFKTLLSYAFYKKTDVPELVGALNPGSLVMADSGAFTARTQGIIVDPHEYAKWVLKYPGIFHVYPNLDELHDVPTSIKNQKIIESYGLRPSPVFHTGEPWRVFHAYCERYSYVMLGGMVGQQGAVMQWIAECFKIAAQYDTKLHGFGQTKMDILRNFPWYSVDSSSWGSGHRYGVVPVWTGSRFGKCQVGDAASVRKVSAHIKRYGVDPSTIADRERYDVESAVRIAACAWNELEEYLRRMHGPQEAPKGYDQPPGLHLHLVSGSPRDLPRAAEAIRSFRTGTPYVPPLLGMSQKQRAVIGK